MNKLPIAIIVILFLGLNVFAQNERKANSLLKPKSLTTELKLKLQIYSGFQDENKVRFEHAKVFILKRNPVTLLREIRLESTFSDKPKVQDKLYLQATALVLIETDERKFKPNYLTGWKLTAEPEVDEDMALISYLISNKFRQEVVAEIEFDNLLWSQTLKIPNEKLYLFGFCQVQNEIFIWNQTIKDNEIELDQYSADSVFTEKEFEKDS